MVWSTWNRSRKLDVFKRDSIEISTRNKYVSIQNKLEASIGFNDIEKANLVQLIFKYKHIFTKVPGRIKNYEYKLVLKDNKI